MSLRLLPKLRKQQGKTEQNDSSADSASTTRPWRRWLRIAARAVSVVLLFGVLVSVIGVCAAPERALSPRGDGSVRVTEITHLFPVTMDRVVAPTTVDEIVRAVKSSTGPISIGGGRNSMGGQTATPNGTQIDLRRFRGVVALDTAARTVTVHSGTTWREVQEAIDPHGLSVKIMQTYNTFTVGGALSVNAHGRYVGQGPMVRSVRSITLVLADGRAVTVSRTEHPDLFRAAVGGYGSVGVIADVTLDLAANTRVMRSDTIVPVGAYLDFFRRRVKADTTVVFHNADLYPPAFELAHAVSYATTARPVTEPSRLQPADQSSWQHRAAYSLMSSGTFGLWFREHVIDPVIFRGNPVTWRNYEASYDVSELEPSSRDRQTYVLQEYFVPVDSLEPFVRRMHAVMAAHRADVINVSIRHALPDTTTDLAWAPTETFAFVVYYRQGTSREARREVGRWTRELIEAAIRCGGRYYLPYQPVATRDQFRRAYPRATELLAAKRRVDAAGKFTNALWDMYQPDAGGNAPAVSASRMPETLPGEVSIALDSVRGYARDEGDEYLTHPEWDLVYTSEAYARWLAAGRAPSGFPYVASVGNFWRSYASTWSASRARYPADMGTHVMLGVIGISTAVEYGLKAIYEHTLGWLGEVFMPAGGTAEDRYAAKVADGYAKLIVDRGWYEFSFAHALGGLWRGVPWFGPGFIRKFERRGALTLEYSIKAVYASLIGVATGSAYAPDDMNRYLVVAGWNDSLAVLAPRADSSLARLRRVAWLDRRYALLMVPRYTPFRDALLGLAHHASQVRVAEISGNRVVTLTGLAPVDWSPPARSEVVSAYASPADGDHVRVLLAVDAHDLLTVLAAIQGEHKFAVDHIYDY